MKHYLAICYLALAGFALPAQAEEACSPVSPPWKLESLAKAGALCADVLLKSDEEGTRQLRVFEAGKPGFATEEAALCKTCGGTLGDPLQGISWSGQTLAVENRGGAREEWGETWKFAKRDGRWVIVGWERNLLDRATASVWSESVNALTGKASAEFAPGGEDKKAKPKRLSCAHPAKLPPAGQVNRWRDGSYACGLKLP